MRLIKDEFVRFFAAGFAGGALLVLATMGLGSSGPVAPSLVASAHAASAR